MLKRFLLVSAIAVSAASFASADIIVHHTGLLTSTASASAGPTDLNFPLPNVSVSLPQFNPNSFCNGVNIINCTLTSIHFGVTDSMSINYEIQNKNLVNAADFSLIANGTITVNGGGNNVIVSLPATTVSVGTVGAGASVTGSATFGSTDTTDYDCSLVPGFCLLTAHTGNGSAAGLIGSGFYVGNGTISFALSGSLTTTAVGGPGLSGATGNASETVSIQYDYAYDEVATAPEPASIALIGGGLLVVGILRKRASR